MILHVSRGTVLLMVAIGQIGLCLFILSMLYLADDNRGAIYVYTTWAALALSVWGCGRVIGGRRPNDGGLGQLWRQLQQAETLNQRERLVAVWLFVGTNLLAITGTFFNIITGQIEGTFYLVGMITVQLILFAVVLGPGPAFTTSIFDAIVMLSSGFSAEEVFRLEYSALILVGVALSGGIIWLGKGIATELQANRASGQDLLKQLLAKEAYIKQLEHRLAELEEQFWFKTTLSDASRQGGLVKYTIRLNGKPYAAQTPYETFRAAGLFHPAVIEKKSDLRVQLLAYRWVCEPTSSGPTYFFRVTKLKILPNEDR